MTENADLQSRLHRELAEAQQQLREKVSFNLSRHCNTTVLSNLQEAHVTNVTQQLREKVSVLSVLKLSLQFL